MASIINTRAAILEARADSPRTGSRRERAASLHRQEARVGYEASMVGFLALLTARAGEADQATALYLRSLDLLEQQARMSRDSAESQIAYNERNDGPYATTMAFLVDHGRIGDAFHVLERSRARSFLALLAERNLVDASVPADLKRRRRSVDAEYNGVQSELRALNRESDEVGVKRLEQRLRELTAEWEHIRDEVRRASPRFAALQYPQPLRVPEAQAALDPGTVLLSYAVGAERTHLFAIRRGAAPAAFSIPIGRQALQERVQAFRDRIRKAAPESSLDVEAAALYDLLVRPAETEIGSTRRILVSPDGPLHTLPFGALKRAGRYLVEWKPLHAVLSATVYAEVRKGRSRPAPVSRVVVFGDPRYPSQATARDSGDPVLRDVLGSRWSLAPLPASRREVASIARLYPGQARVYLGDEATEERATTEVRRARYVHFACHGILDERFPLNSALALTIPKDVPEGGDNGLLQAWEVIERVRLDADLVTLSACDSGLGGQMGGEGLIGLTRAFQYAGARSVVASFWSVPDRSTVDLMERFYAGLQSGLSKDAALRRAQVAMIRGGPTRSHPLRWAGFELFGDWK